MIDLEKERETVHNAINTLFDIAKVQKAEIDMLNVDIANKQAEIDSLKAQLAKVESGEFVVVPADQLYQWGHMANYAQEYGCPECFEARGYAHSLACEINEYLKPVNAAQENSHE